MYNQISRYPANHSIGQILIPLKEQIEVGAFNQSFNNRLIVEI